MAFENLKKRCNNFTKELGVPVTRFCENAGISRTHYYDWQNGKVELSSVKLEGIVKYLERYGF